VDICHEDNKLKREDKLSVQQRQKSTKTKRFRAFTEPKERQNNNSDDLQKQQSRSDFNLNGVIE
jgi:hypothetical protein